MPQHKITTLLLAASISLLPAASFAHMGESHEVDPDSIPTISLSVNKDEIGGFNVQIITENFAWAPERASQEHVPGEGHAHIYVDGVKVARVYSEWYHLSTASLDLAPGVYEVTVDLNGNDHGAYVLDGQKIEASAEIIVEEESTSAMPAGEEMHSETKGQSESLDWLSIGAVTALGVLLAAGGFLIGRRFKS